MNASDTDDPAPESVSPPGEQVQRVAAIISRGQRSRPGAFSTLLLLLATALLSWLSFPPVDLGQLAWICLVPLLQLVRPERPTCWMYRITYVVGVAYWLLTLQWMRLGDPTMYIALVAMGLYLGAYWVGFLWLTRVAVHQIKVPLLVAAPVIWTGLEYVRAYLFTGFSWYYIGHTQYRWVELTQISDLTGAYLVSFVVVLANASLAMLVPVRWFEKWQLIWESDRESVLSLSTKAKWIGAGAAFAVVLLSHTYGVVRRSGETFPRGPRIALIQGNFVASVRNDRDDPRDIFMTHRHLTGMTVGESPDVVVWPEGMFPYGMYVPEKGVTDEQLKANVPEIPLDLWRGNQSQQALTDLADMTNAALIIGLSTFVGRPTDSALYNSAVMVQPGIGVVNRYDKIHRVPFGEYIPLRDSVPFLQALTPFRGKFGIDRGTEAHVFRYKDWQLIPTICFEDTVPHLVRKIAASANVNGPEQTQVLVNLTNDGWFHGSSELEQHLITSSFRAIETRTPLVRAVNTGISAIIDGDGVVREPDEFIDGGNGPGDDLPQRKSVRDPRTGRFYKQLNCALVADVPLDPRTSLYVSWGDWFAMICLTGCLATLLRGLFARRTVEKAAS